MNESQYPINPSTLFLLHLQNDNKPALAVDDLVEYDRLHESNCESLERFKSYLDKYYTYDLVYGTEYPVASFATYRITGVKAEDEWRI